MNFAVNFACWDALNADRDDAILVEARGVKEAAEFFAETIWENSEYPEQIEIRVIDKKTYRVGGDSAYRVSA